MDTYLRGLAVSILCLGLVGCGGSDPGATPPAATQAPGATPTTVTEEPESNDGPSGANPYFDADLCALIPLDAVAEAAGELEPEDAESTGSSPASCRYTLGLPVGSFPSTTAISIQMLSSFTLERLAVGDAAQDVPGLGDEAWEHPLTDTHLLYVRRGDLVFWVAAAGGGDWTQMTRSVAELVLSTL